MKRPVKLGKAARGRRGNSEYKKATRRTERRAVRQLTIKQLQFVAPKRRYLDYY